jgi:hypothetical protein
LHFAAPETTPRFCVALSHFGKSVRNRSSFSSLFLGFPEEAQCCPCWCKEEAAAEGEGGGGEQAEEQEQGEEVSL